MTIDRSDPVTAKRVVGELCPARNAQRWWARYILQSVDVASSISASSWAITLFPHLVRLNVGQIAVLELWKGYAVFYCFAPVTVKPSKSIKPYRDFPGYRAVKAKTERWRVDADALLRVPELLIKKHLELVRLAAESKRSTPFRSAHSPGLVSYLKQIVAGTTQPDEPLFAEEVSPGRYFEGALRTVTVNAYERDREARARCIEHHGVNCAVCGMAFGSVYGPVAEGFIHVHHIKPLSEIGIQYQVDPITDLRPVCPNCHAVIHLGGQTRTIEEVRQLLANANSGRHELQPHAAGCWRASRCTAEEDDPVSGTKAPGTVIERGGQAR